MIMFLNSADLGIMQTNKQSWHTISCTFDHLVIVVFYLSYTILVNDLHEHLKILLVEVSLFGNRTPYSFEVDRQSSLELISTQSKNLKTLFIVHIRLMVLVKNGETIVPAVKCEYKFSMKLLITRRGSQLTERIHVLHMVQERGPPGNPASISLVSL